MATELISSPISRIKYGGSMTIPFRKSLGSVDLLFSSRATCYHLYVPLWGSPGADHLCGNWVPSGLGIDTLAHSQGVSLREGTREGTGPWATPVFLLLTLFLLVIPNCLLLFPPKPSSPEAMGSPQVKQDDLQTHVTMRAAILLPPGPGTSHPLSGPQPRAIK